MAVTIGALALQGGFQEHLAFLQAAANCSSRAQSHKLKFIEVRNASDLSRCAALIIPGGESTAIAHVASNSGLLEPLRRFVKIDRKPVWGTCAGLILLSEQANATKKGGQELIGGLDVRVQRNHFGRQIESFEADVDLPFLSGLDHGCRPGAESHFPGVFIRAPIVEQLLDNDLPDKAADAKLGGARPKGKVEILAVLPGRRERAKTGPVNENEAQSIGDVSDIVAVRQGNVFGTSFHPELTGDVRIHAWWLGEVLDRVDANKPE